jgi:hypothetical protein
MEYVDEIVRDGEIVGVKLHDDLTEGGDPGGPYFHKESGEAYMCGVHKGIADSNGNSYATTAETTEDVLPGDWLTQ